MFTFKKDKPETGLAGVGNPNPNTNIKLKGKVVGHIQAPNWQSKDNVWIIWLAVEAVVSWKWLTIKRRFETEPAAREWLKEKYQEIREKFALHEFDDD